MSTPRPSGMRIHLILPRMSAREAAVLVDVLSDVLSALWSVHGVDLCEHLEHRAARESIDNPDPDDIFAITELDDIDDFAE